MGFSLCGIQGEYGKHPGYILSVSFGKIIECAILGILWTVMPERKHSSKRIRIINIAYLMTVVG